MKRKEIVLVVALIMVTSSLLCFRISYLQTADNVVPNGSFESGTLGLIPDNWVMKTMNWNELGVENTTYTNDMFQDDYRYFEGSKSLHMFAYVTDTDGLMQGRAALTIAETEDWINASQAKRVRIYISEIVSQHSDLPWGWANNIFLRINNVSVSRTYCAGSYYSWIFTHGETCNFNQYNYTAIGADGESWYVYDYDIPEAVDKSHMKIQIVADAGDWTFGNTNYFSSLDFYVDKVELILPPNPDIDGDGVVDNTDVLRVAAAYGSRPGDPKWNHLCDLMRDNVVDWFDVGMVARMFGWTSETPFEPKAVEWKLNITLARFGENKSYTVVILSDYIVHSDYIFNYTTAELIFNVTSSIDGFCNITIPKGLMNGAFRVELDDVAAPSILTWNITHTSIYFSSTQLSHRVKIIGNTPGDIKVDGLVDIFDVVTMATCFGDPTYYQAVYYGPHFY